jgi:hypothetical protein
VSAALAETREELADLWAEAREDARRQIEDEQFAATQAATDTVDEVRGAAEPSTAAPSDAR